MNRRLANDQITESDPKFPKRQFPSQSQCPNCYLPGIRNIDQLSDHESPWNMRECLLFLTSYYSRYQIVPIDQPNTQKLDKNEPEEVLQVDEPRLPDPVVEKADANPAPVRLLGRDGVEKINDEENGSPISLTFMFFLAAFATFGVIFIYFNYFKRIGGKSKKHIIWLDDAWERLVA